MLHRTKGAAFGRRALLAGAGLSLLALTAPGRDGGLVQVGLADGSGHADTAVRAQAEALLGRGIAILRFPSTAGLRDHLAAGTLDAAMLPLTATGGAMASAVLPLPAPQAVLLFAPAHPRHNVIVARATADAAADAALCDLLQREGVPAEHLRLTTLAPAHLADNLAAGLIDAALVLGPLTSDALERGFGMRSLRSAEARAVAPRLALTVRPVFAEA